MIINLMTLKIMHKNKLEFIAKENVVHKFSTPTYIIMMAPLEPTMTILNDKKN